MSTRSSVVSLKPIESEAEVPVDETTTTNRVDMRYLARALVKYSASDLHIKVGRPPLFRVNGKLVAAKMVDLTSEQVQSLIYGLISKKQAADLEENRHIDLSFSVTGLGRFRCNVYFQQGTLSAAVRMIPWAIPRMEDLGLPEVLKEISLRQRGLVLVTGATGSGKSTTLASIIQHINETRSVHVLCIEDPIEFLHRDVKATITQREVGSDAKTLQDALFAGLRQDPDIIMISELRNPETIQTALTAAETGHLVLATLHTNDSVSTIDRIVDVFPASVRDQVRIQLSSSLAAIVSQQLIPRADGTGRVAACEVLINSPTIENYIAKNQLEKIPDLIAQSNDYYRMQTFNLALERLIASGMVNLEDAMRASNNPTDLRLRVQGLSREKGFDIHPALSLETDEDARPVESEDRGGRIIQAPPSFRKK